jgi:malonyl-CoA O-methyltransferase
MAALSMLPILPRAMAAADPPSTPTRTLGDERAASSARALDEHALAHVAARLARAEGPPWLHQEIARRLDARLAVVRRTPGVVLQWPGRLGAGEALLRARYPQATLVSVEPAPLPRAAPAPRRWWPLRPRAAAASIGDDDPWPRADLLWSNMALHAVRDPPALLARWRRALAPDGFLMCSTLGPGTLAELRALYRDLRWGSPGAAFVDMHDLGDMLVRAGFADPVMDQEPLRLAWATPEAALAELRTLGGNADPARLPGLRTPRWRARLLAALAERAGPDGRIAFGFEIVYGHAFNAPPRAAVAARTEVAVEDLRAMARARRGPAR